MKKWIVIAVVLLGGGGYLGWRNVQSKNARSTPGSGSDTSLATIATRDINFAVSVAGEIGPADQVSVRPEVNGKIQTLPVDIGDQVKKDDVLFTLDDTDLQTQRSSRQIEIEAAKIQLEKARRDFDRSQQLFSEKLISTELFQDSKTTFELARNSLDRAQKELNLIEYQLTKTKIVAPFDCTVLTRPVSVGQAVSGSGGFNSGTEVLTIANLNDMIVNAHVNQADVTRLKSGQEVEVQVEAVPGLRVKGGVERIAPQATIKNNIKGFATRIILKNVDPRIQPGMTANVTIPVTSAQNVVAAPLAAVFSERNERDQVSEQFVFVKKDDKFERRLIRVGISDINFAEVLEGLSAGDIVSTVKPPEDAILTTETPAAAPSAAPASSPQAGDPKTAVPEKRAAGKRPGES